MIRHQPRSTRTARLFPYTTLCLSVGNQVAVHRPARARLEGLDVDESAVATAARRGEAIALVVVPGRDAPGQSHGEDFPRIFPPFPRSEEHTSELQSLMRISYAVFCLNKTNNDYNNQHTSSHY